MTQNGQTNNRRRWVVIGLFVLFLAATITVAVLNRTLSQSEQLAGQVERDRWPVNIVTVQAQPFVERIVQTGILQALEEAQLNAEVSARVREIRADLGDRVRKGQSLVILDASAYQLAFRSANAQLAEAKTMTKLYGDQRDRAKKLLAQGHLSQEEFDMVVGNADSAEAKTRLAEAQLATARRNLAETIIRAPFAGRISERLASPGELVSPGTPVITMVKDGVVKVDLALSESRILLVKKGMVAPVTVPAVAEREFPGRITRTGVAAARGSGAFPVRVEIDNDDGMLMAGMRATVEIELDRIPDAVVVTRDEVVRQNQKDLVYVAVEKDGEFTAASRPVVLGSRSGQQVRIVEGLAPGDLLITVGQNSVKHGSPLTIVEKDGERVAPPVGAAAAPTPDEPATEG
ncbi:MAG: efflux RND transporter periplasmic adaptor subunit [Candidatus Lernaella stagnicola]|nr:efflux RND transporter periplasmic adaptor subunit [Candidatus Lernaella stagnicola]